MSRARRAPTASLLALTAVAACAHYPATAPLAAVKAPTESYLFDTLPSSDADDDLFVCLAFSGGGTRAASFSYGVLEKLRRTAIVRPKDGKHESLLDEVDCISSVSGGSFTAAYYALNGQAIFTRFRDDFLVRDIQSDLVHKALNPLNWPRLLSPYFSRIDLASELYGDVVFGHKTYGDLLAAGRRPFIILNSTDLTTGDDFAFTQEHFDLIGSDLNAFPLARAVAASSAFPFLLSPITLTNHAQPPGYVPPAALANGAGDYFNNRRRYSFLTHSASYLDKASNPYVHVMDGGLADNVGARALLRQVWEPTGFVARRLNRGKVSKLVLIVVNAKNDEPQSRNQDESPPGLVDVALKTATTAMDNYSFEIIELARDLKLSLTQAQRDLDTCRKVARVPEDCPSFAAPYELHVVDVNLDAIPDAERRKKLLSIGTSFSLKASEVDELVSAAGELLDRNPDFQALLAKLR